MSTHLGEVRRLADRGTTLRALVEEGPRRILREAALWGDFRLRLVDPARHAWSSRPKGGRRGRFPGPIFTSSQPASPSRWAALCRHQGVRELWNADRDFSRFPELVVRNPMVA